jgi:Ca2+-binding RTX toxin-like protein
MNTTEIFDGHAGNDTLDGRGGFDQAEYGNDPAVTGGITVNMANGQVTGDASIGTDMLLSIEAVRGTNSIDHYDATNFGLSGSNISSTGTFNQFEGLGGDDEIIGNGNTQVSYTSSTGSVTVDLAAGTANGNTSVGQDTLTNVSRVLGSNSGDTILGDSNNNVLNGLGGNDLINGRDGNDTLTGGGGNDTFVFAANNGNDTITDFQIGQDQIRLDGFFTSNTDQGFLDFVAALNNAANGVTTISDSHLTGVAITLTNVNVNQLHASDFVIN